METAMGKGLRAASAALLSTLLSAALHAGSPVQPSADLASLSIEDLMNESVTSVSKQEESLSDAPAAISVLSNDDLRRSGSATIMDALRLVPGMDVGQANSSEWAVSDRGFNNIFSNNLLVLVDGRAVYSPLFGGVFWSLQQDMLDDVDRIEVIRGPGGAIWGANAVNGVINVISMSARDTQGGLLYGGIGDQQEVQSGMRYGGQLDATTFYRVFFTYEKDANSVLPNGLVAGDGWEGLHGGFRLDHYQGANTQMTLQADSTASTPDGNAARAYNLNTLGRWTRHLSDQSSVEVQAYYDTTSFDNPIEAKVRADTYDLTAQQTLGLSANQNFIWGIGYRYINDQWAQTNPFIEIPHTESRQSLFSTFVQDEFQIIPKKLSLTIGGKLERNDFTGWEFQPSIRAAFKPTPKTTVWAAISRAVSTPDILETKDTVAIATGAPFQGPGGSLYIPTVVSNSELASEVLWAYEVGYRAQLSSRVSADIALFYNDYKKLITNSTAIQSFEPGIPFGVATLPFENLLSAKTYGGEASLTVSPVDAWRLTASYSQLSESLRGAAATIAAYSFASPEHQAKLRSSIDITPRISLDAQWRYVSAIPGISAYNTADVRIAFRLSRSLEVSLVGQNLLEGEHLEQAPQAFTLITEVPREFYGKVTWHF